MFYPLLVTYIIPVSSVLTGVSIKKNKKDYMNPYIRPVATLAPVLLAVQIWTRKSKL